MEQIPRPVTPEVRGRVYVMIDGQGPGHDSWMDLKPGPEKLRKFAKRAMYACGSHMEYGEALLLYRDYRDPMQGTPPVESVEDLQDGDHCLLTPELRGQVTIACFDGFNRVERVWGLRKRPEKIGVFAFRMSCALSHYAIPFGTYPGREPKLFIFKDYGGEAGRIVVESVDELANGEHCLFKPLEDQDRTYLSYDEEMWQSYRARLHRLYDYGWEDA